jgi:hypothetical protein
MFRKAAFDAAELLAVSVSLIDTRAAVVTAFLTCVLWWNDSNSPTSTLSLVGREPSKISSAGTSDFRPRRSRGTFRLSRSEVGRNPLNCFAALAIAVCIQYSVYNGLGLFGLLWFMFAFTMLVHKIS